MVKLKTLRDLAIPSHERALAKNVDLPSNPPVLHSPINDAQGALSLENADKYPIGSSSVKLWPIRKLYHPVASWSRLLQTEPPTCDVWERWWCWAECLFGEFEVVAGGGATDQRLEATELAMYWALRERRTAAPRIQRSLTGKLHGLP